MIKFSRFILIQTAVVFLLGLFPVLSLGESYLKEIFNDHKGQLGKCFPLPVGFFTISGDF